MKKTIFIISLSLTLLLFLCFPQTTFAGARNGLSLWLFTVIPTLLPFMIITNILVQLNGDTYLSRVAAPITKRVLHISTSANYALIIGILCGYPMGAKAINDLIERGKISKQEGQYLLCFCNNASPMFIISFICYSSLGNIKYLPYVIIPIYASVFICCFIFKLWTNKSTPITKTNENSSNTPITLKIFDHSILSSFESLTKFGGYIILYSILSAFIIYNTPLPGIIKIITVGFIEITTGITCIAGVPSSIYFMIPLICFITAFGGLSTISQTASMISKSNLLLSKYIFAKLINGLIAGTIAYIMLVLML